MWFLWAHKTNTQPPQQPQQNPYNSHMARVLIVEDESQIATVLEAYLRREGFQTERAENGTRALEYWRAFKPDLIVLDLQIPAPDGLEVLRKVRASSNTAVIIVTARAEDIDRLLGLELGADDYVVKPVSPREVVARVKAVLRRIQPAEIQHIHRLAHHSGVQLELDSASQIARVDRARLELTPTEYRLLEVMIRHPARAFSRAELLEVALPESDALERAVDTHLKNLRRKLDEKNVGEMLETVRGTGYRLWSGL
jgi:two-component system, OmpR family, response regulator AdeR